MSILVICEDPGAPATKGFKRRGHSENQMPTQSSRWYPVRHTRDQCINIFCFYLVYLFRVVRCLSIDILTSTAGPQHPE